MKTKDEVALFIKHYIKLIQTQFNKIPKCIRSDRESEYIIVEIQNYPKHQSIEIQYTNAYSPQQKEVVERKNQSLLEMVQYTLLDVNLSTNIEPRL